MKDEVEDLKLLLSEQETELNILRKVGQTLTSELDIDVILSRIIDACRELVFAEAWSILLVDPDRKELVFSAIHGGKSKELERSSLKITKGIAGKVSQTGIPKIVNYVEEDPDFYSDIDKATGFTTKSILCVPLISRGKILGVIEIINKQKGQHFTPEDLERVENFTKFASIALENAQLYNQAVNASITDDLSGLYNNRFINKRLSIELELAKKKKQPMSLVFIDLDNFKRINDNYGHLIGSLTISTVGKWLKEKLKGTTEIIARYGGDEFLFVLLGKNVKEAQIISEKLRKDLEQNEFHLDDKINIKITASFGISAYPELADTLEDLLGMADKAMYEVKVKSRNAVQIFKPS